MPGRFAETVGLDDSFEKFFLGRIPTLARAPMPGRRGRWRARCGAVRGASTKVGQASTKGPLGEPVLMGVGRASTKRLGKPVLIGRANFYSGLHSGQRCLALLRCPLGQVPARHV